MPFDDVLSNVVKVIAAVGGTAGIAAGMHALYKIIRDARRERQKASRDNAESNLNLTIKEEEHIESQYQQHFKNQEVLIQRLQSGRDAKYQKLEERLDEVYDQLREYIRQHAIATTQRDNCQERLTVMEKRQEEREKKHTEEIDRLQRRYNYLKRITGHESDSEEPNGNTPH